MTGHGRKDGNSIAVNVALGERSYDIEIGTGLVERAGELIGPHLRRPMTAIVTDENVAGLHLDRLTASLEAAGISSTAIICPPGEASKSYTRLTTVCDGLLDAGIERSDTIIAFGGGVIGDPRRIRRGRPAAWRQFHPDADQPAGPGRFLGRRQDRHQLAARQEPDRRLSSAGRRHRRYFAARHPAGARVCRRLRRGRQVQPDRRCGVFWLLEDNGAQIGAGDLQARMRAVETSCLAKADIVARDEHEHGCRALLNLGHTFGHALEAATATASGCCTAKGFRSA